MNTHIKNLADQALTSTQWSVVNNLSTEIVDKNTELEKFAELLLDDCLKLCDQELNTQNKRFLPVIQVFVNSFILFLVGIIINIFNYNIVNFKL
jgi:hypothetical protein